MKIAPCLLMIFLMLDFAHAQSEQVSDRWKENYKRWQTLSPERKAELKRRFESLRKMDDTQRKKFEDRAGKFRKLTFQQKQRLKEKLELYRSLSENQRSAFRFQK